ncbi:MAG TPA: hypothetical protein VMZ30_10920 [Pyrinomonadaceae bacterium]|nr:hypothetical protein [Pyrinomonadaceae bacterium]
MTTIDSRRRIGRSIALPGAFLKWVFVGILALQTAMGAPRKLIWTGWDIPTPAMFRTNIADFEKLAVFDGSGIIPTRHTSSGPIELASEVFTNAHWNWDEFEKSVSDLRSAKVVRCTNNFLLVTANPGNVDWFNDEGWAEITTHWMLLARLARKGGLSGLIFDPEPYRKPWSQFLYSNNNAGTNSFVQTQIKARERGRQVMRAITTEYPNMTVFAYRLFSDLFRLPDSGKQISALQTDRFGLLPAFINGWCDTMPPTITLVDGNEAAFRYTKTHQYSAAFTKLKTRSPLFLSEENREKLRSQMLVSHGIYLDILLPGYEAPIDLEGISPANHVVTFASAALDASDGFVWVYGEKGTFWNTTKSPTWTNKFAGIQTALLIAKEPNEYAKKFIAAAKSEMNLFGGRPFNDTEWAKWQERGSTGRVGFTNGVVTFTGTQNGTIGKATKVRPGEAFIVSVQAKHSGLCAAGLIINWRARGHFVAQSEVLELTGEGGEAENGWRTVSGFVTVPPDADEMLFLCFARGEASLATEASFKDPFLTRLSD